MTIRSVDDGRGHGGSRLEYVILLSDSSYFCTCLALQNRGLVCRHFFHLMKEDELFKYSIRFTPLRWFTESHQDDKSLETSIRVEPSLPSRRFRYAHSAVMTPPATSLGDSIVSRTQRSPPTASTQAKRKRRIYAQVMDKSRDIAEELCDISDYSLDSISGEVLEELSDVTRKLKKARVTEDDPRPSPTGVVLPPKIKKVPLGRPTSNCTKSFKDSLPKKRKQSRQGKETSPPPKKKAVRERKALDRTNIISPNKSTRSTRSKGK